MLDRAKVGLGLTAFAGIRVEGHSHEHAKSFVNAVLAIPGVVACHLVSGDIDFLLEVVVPDMASYEGSFLRRLLAVPAVRDIRTSFAMRTHKAGGALPIAGGPERTA